MPPFWHKKWTYQTISIFYATVLQQQDIKKKKKTIESPYQPATIASTSLAFVNTTVHNIMDINS